MAGLITLARRAAFCGVLLCVLRGGGTVLAGWCLTPACDSGCPLPPCVGASCPGSTCVGGSCPGSSSARGCICTPNAQGFGYFTVKWRQWPGEARPDINFSQSIGAEVLPTPEGQRQLPPSRAKVAPGQTPAGSGIPPLDEGQQPKPGTPLLPEPPIVPPEGSPTETPKKPPVELPVDTPIEKPAEPTDTPPAAPVEKAAEAPKESAMLKPFLQSGWAALAEEPRGVSPLMGRSWPGPLPARVPDAGPSAPVGMPADNRGSGLPNASVRRPRLAPRSAGAGEFNRQEVTISTAPDRQPSSPRLQPDPLRANWTAALDPGRGGDMGRPIPVYPPVERSRPAVYQAPVEPRAAPAVEQQPPEQRNEQPADRSQGVQQFRGLPVALGGYCPVELGDGERWLPGDPRWPVVHQGSTYLFHGPAQRQRFLANPRRYVPAYGAHDPVLLVDGDRRVPGHTDYCVIYDGQLYMFSSAATLARFKEGPQRYIVNGRQ